MRTKYFTIAIICILLPLPVAFAADTLGHLFFSPEERSQIMRAVTTPQPEPSKPRQVEKSEPLAGYIELPDKTLILLRGEKIYPGKFGERGEIYLITSEGLQQQVYFSDD